MGWFTAIVVFVLIWWIVLFAVLPFGTKPVVDAQDTPGGWRGAPERPHLLRTIVTTTVVSAVLWVGAIALIHSPYLSFRDMAAAMRDD